MLDPTGRFEDPQLESLLPPTALNRRGFLAGGAGAGFALAAGPLAAQSVIRTPADGLYTADMKVPTGQGDMPAYLACPVNGARHATVLVVPEIFGMHEYQKDICRRLALRGYTGVTLDGFFPVGGGCFDSWSGVGGLQVGHRLADHVGLLEGAASGHRLGPLAGDGDQGAGIDIRVGDGRHQVGRTRSAGRHAHAGLAGGAGVALGGETAALFVTGKDGADLRLGQRLMDLHARAAGVGEDDFATLAFERLDKNLAPEHQGADVLVAGGLVVLRRGGRAHVVCPGSWPVVVDFPVWNKKPTTVAGRGFL